MRAITPEEGQVFPIVYLDRIYVKVAEIANDVEQRRIELLKNNAQRAKQQVKDAQARARMKMAEEELRKSREPSSSNLSLTGN